MVLAVCLYFIHSLWADNRQLRVQCREDQLHAIERVATQAARTSEVLADATSAIEGAMIIINTAPRFNPNQLEDLMYVAREMRRYREEDERQPRRQV